MSSDPEATTWQRYPSIRAAENDSNSDLDSDSLSFGGGHLAAEPHPSQKQAGQEPAGSMQGESQHDR